MLQHLVKFALKCLLFNMKVAFISEMPAEHFLHWNDGLRAALQVLSEKYGWVIDFYNLPSLKTAQITQDEIDSYDFALYWGGFLQKQHQRKVFKKSGLCFAGGPTHSKFASNFDVIFAESAIDEVELKQNGSYVVKAFGTNTKLFKPNPQQPKLFDYLYPAAFAKWKRHDLFFDYVSSRSHGTGSQTALAVGYIQPNNHEYECVQVCLDNGIGVMPWIPAEALVWLYNASREVVLAADPNGGCQRSVLEAKACGIPVTVLNQQHPKLVELQDLSREEVLTNWSEEAYAEQLKLGIETVINSSQPHLVFKDNHLMYKNG